jgi:hypothetical protein
VRGDQITRTRRSEITHEARRACSVAQARGRTVDEIQEELLRTFPGELAAGEARMYAHGWTVAVVREGLQALAAADGLEWSGLQDVDVARWLRGEVYPRESLERLCRLFRCHQAQLGWPPRGKDVPISFAGPPLSPVASAACVLPAAGRRDWSAWFGIALSRLIALVAGWDEIRSSEALQVLVHQEVLMLDAVRPAPDEDRDYTPSRRQLLITLLALPAALSPSPQLGRASTVLVQMLLTHCATSLTAAWHLLKQSDLAIVEQHVSSYVLALGALAHRPSANQAEAARLASQAHRVLGLVALHRRQFGLVDHHYKQALGYAEIAGDPALQASVLLVAASRVLLYGEDFAAASAIHERVQGLEPRITPLQRSKLHASLAIGLAREGRERDSLRHLDLAVEEYPASPEGDPSFARQDFGPGHLVLFRGLASLALARAFPDHHHQQQAWDTFNQIGETASQGAVAERVRVEIINHQTGTALEMRDLESFVRLLSHGVEGARKLRSALRMHEATTNWRRALEAWPAEPRVTALAEFCSLARPNCLPPTGRPPALTGRTSTAHRRGVADVPMASLDGRHQAEPSQPTPRTARGWEGGSHGDRRRRGAHGLAGASA